MELILISESKLKVMLTPDDMRLYNLDCDTMDSGTAATRRAFWNILDEARAQTGFDPGGEKVFVQLYPGKEGGCEMFVTKIGGTPPTKGRMPLPSPPSHPRKNNPLGREHVYAFPQLSYLLAACRRLNGSFTGTASAYEMRDSGEYYLILSEECPLLSEYEGSKCKPRETPYILEYGHCFCRDAIRVLAGLA